STSSVIIRIPEKSEDGRHAAAAFAALGMCRPSRDSDFNVLGRRLFDGRLGLVRLALLGPLGELLGTLVEMSGHLLLLTVIQLVPDGKPLFIHLAALLVRLLHALLLLLECRCGIERAALELFQARLAGRLHGVAALAAP